MVRERLGDCTGQGIHQTDLLEPQKLLYLIGLEVEVRNFVKYFCYRVIGPPVCSHENDMKL